MNMRCCFNPKFLLTAAVLAGGIWLVAPQAALPVAVVLIALSCPFSMFLAMRQPQGHSCTTSDTDNSSEHDPELYEHIRPLSNENKYLREPREEYDTKVVVPYW